MADVLQHPFFQEEELALPLVPYHGHGLDVIISYQSTQVSPEALPHCNLGRHPLLKVLDMWRLRRCLNALGITTADGTQVPPGADWRKW